MREVLSRHTIFVLAIILGLILFGIAIYVIEFKPSSERILVEGESVEISSVSLYPEQSKVEANAWFEYGELYMDITLLELDVNEEVCMHALEFYCKSGSKRHICVIREGILFRVCTHHFSSGMFVSFRVRCISKNPFSKTTFRIQPVSLSTYINTISFVYL